MNTSARQYEFATLRVPSLKGKGSKVCTARVIKGGAPPNDPFAAPFDAPFASLRVYELRVRELRMT